MTDSRLGDPIMNDTDLICQCPSGGGGDADWPKCNFNLAVRLPCELLSQTCDLHACYTTPVNLMANRPTNGWTQRITAR